MKFLIYNGNIQLRIEIDKIQWYQIRKSPSVINEGTIGT